jgi:hypothetical protein
MSAGGRWNRFNKTGIVTDSPLMSKIFNAPGIEVERYYLSCALLKKFQGHTLFNYSKIINGLKIK